MADSPRPFFSATPIGPTIDTRPIASFRERIFAPQRGVVRIVPAYKAASSYVARAYADLEAWGGAEMPIVQDAAILTAGAHDQAYERAGDRTLRLGSPRQRQVRAAQRNGPSAGA